MQFNTGQVLAEFMDPNVVLDLVDKPVIAQLAREVRQKLERSDAGIMSIPPLRKRNSPGTS